METIEIRRNEDETAAHAAGPVDAVTDATNADHADHLNALAQETGGTLRPHYEYVALHAGRLAFGQLAIEPNLGLLRVATKRRNGPLTSIGWSDDHGPCRPTGRYGVDRLFSVVAPGITDRRLIKQHIDQATRRRQDVPAETARLIAAHLHLGPRSALYRFALDGAVLDQLFDELDRVSAGRPTYRPWVNALARYGVSRQDHGPLSAWRQEVVSAMYERTSALGQRLPERPARTQTQGEHGPIAGKYVRTETAVQLIDAAFAFGMASARSRRWGAIVKQRG